MGARKQSVKDAELLLSYNVANSMKTHGFTVEAEYIQTVAQWHEASDGRGLSELQRCAYNKSMLTYLVKEILPEKDQYETYDFSAIDINT